MSRDPWPGYGSCGCPSCASVRDTQRRSGTAVVLVLLVLLVWLLASGGAHP